MDEGRKFMYTKRGGWKISSSVVRKKGIKILLRIEREKKKWAKV